MLAKRYNRESVDANNGKPRVARIVLCNNHGGYLTFAGECACSSQHDFETYVIVGTTYGWLHDTGGNIRFWGSESGARGALKARAGVRPAPSPALSPTLVSDALKEGLKVYHCSSFMCNTMWEIYSRAEAKVLEDSIAVELGEWFTLDSLLNATCKEYRARRILADGRWRDEELHAMRVIWWKALISRLESEGK